MLKDMTNRELIDLEDSLDYRDPEMIGEIMSRAEEIREGITERYTKSFEWNDMIPDEIFEEAVSLLV